MLVFLHPNLGALAALTAADNPRYSATAGILLCDQGNGLYRAEATDGRRLAIVQGPLLDPPGDVEDAAPTVCEVIVAGADWLKAFRLKPGRGKPNVIALAAAEQTLTLSAGSQSLQAEPVEGRFPDTKRVLPRGLPVLTVRVDPVLFGELLRVAAQFLPADQRGVLVHFYGPGKPLGISCRNDAGQAFDALLVPLVVKEKP